LDGSCHTCQDSPGNYMNNNFTIGAIFSVYEQDSPAYLFEALYSILRNQTHPLDSAVGVIEGTISEQLEKVVGYFNEVDWIRIPRQTEAPGQFGLPYALNRAIAEIEASIVLKVDTDDWNDKDRVSLTLKEFKMHENLVLHGSDLLEWDESLHDPISVRFVPKGQKEILKKVKWQNPFNGPTVAFRKAFVLEMGGFPIVGANEDYALWGKVLMNNAETSNSSKLYVHQRGGFGLMKRRRGNRYLKGEKQTLMYLRNEGVFSLPVYLVHLSLKSLIRQLPESLLSYIYNHLRKSVPADCIHLNGIAEARFEFDNLCNEN